MADAFGFDTELDGCAFCGLVLGSGHLVVGELGEVTDAALVATGTPFATNRRYLFHKACHDKHTALGVMKTKARLATVSTPIRYPDGVMERSWLGKLNNLFTYVTYLGPNPPSPVIEGDECMVIVRGRDPGAPRNPDHEANELATPHGYRTYQVAHRISTTATDKDSVIAALQRLAVQNAISVRTAAMSLADPTINPRERRGVHVYVVRLRDTANYDEPASYFIVVKAMSRDYQSRHTAIKLATVAIDATLEILNTIPGTTPGRATDVVTSTPMNLASRARGHFLSYQPDDERLCVNAFYDSGAGQPFGSVGSLWAFSIDAPMTVAAFNPRWRPSGTASDGAPDRLAARPFLFRNSPSSLEQFPPHFIHGVVEPAYVVPEAVGEVSISFV